MFANAKEVLEFIAHLRREHRAIRSEVAARTVLGMAYAAGRQWTTVAPGPMGNVAVDAWAEDWDPKSTEIRVVDNRIGPLYRRIAAETNATRIESQVLPPSHLKTFDAVDQSKVAQWILNAVSDDIGMTRVARIASSLRWVSGSSLIQVTLSQKRREVPTDILMNPDGSPVSIDDKWVRWEPATLVDLIWDPSNMCPDLEAHSSLILEKIYTEKQFVQLFGPVAQYGFERDGLPTVDDLAPSYVQLGNLNTSTYFQQYARNSQTKAIRVSYFMEAAPRDPTRWPNMFIVLDTSPAQEVEGLTGKVINFDDPESPFGHHQRPLFKLDAFRRDDAVLAFGAPHVMMSDQDRLNLVSSTQIQQLLSVVHGYWVVDKRSADKDQFTNDLMTSVGGVLTYDSQGGALKPPSFVHPPPPEQAFILLNASVAQAMQNQVHITQANLGEGKTHISKDFQERLLQEGNTVTDTIIQRDVDVYSDALNLTLGTVRLAVETPGRMVARLRDRHGLAVNDLQAFMGVDPRNSPLIVRVRTYSIINRSVAERFQQIQMALQMGLITQAQAAIAHAEELERPIIKCHDLQLQFCHKAVRQILAGESWPGIPHLPIEYFQYSVENAMWGLDLTVPNDREAMARLQEALLVQKQLSMENTIPPNVLDNSQGASLSYSRGGRNSASAGAPGSINPTTAPVGAAGGLPLGLPPR